MLGMDQIFMALIMIMGVIMIITNKPLLLRKEKYTEESLKKYPRPAGIMIFLLGACALGTVYSLRLLGEDKINGWIVVALLVATALCIVGNIIIVVKVLVKK
ncbi:hypothetical protein NE683_18015 [Bariatricus massiliensis]|uniref:DUF3784 domain-containing protein n=1 Tax=Bariatricus massiliensis TaxID=1745713 RepID=A0ABS8DKV8_9FIRM|nr:hypothetical protein [Bariatricus massiliensis]MCB7305910.1 hypothetical protein [Bariatricus massiliensis]MCB7376500.1 hypothetical protein [Bariatricus massiliensis]MCB7389053.1 hypothetical protein [Bariatricus massiliensis]MCB7413226.1 hypothetical protein [Bariatricus massiliensis]MCQ5255122.1 hypothetical protein [Bariatricus massiliensis]